MLGKRYLFLFLIVFFSISLFAKWQVSGGKFTSGLNITTGNFVTGFRPGANFDLIKYQKSAKNALKEGKLLDKKGKKGRWSWNAKVNHFTGVKVNTYAGIGGNVTFDKKYRQENNAIAKEKAKSKGIQEVEGAAYNKDLKSVILDKNGNPVEVPGVAILRKGNTHFGWTHISYNRPDGTNHARELKEVYNLPDQDQSVKDLIIYAIETGDRKLQVREVNGKVQKRWVYTKVIDGKPMKVIVDGPGSQYEGSIITAYPTKYKRDRHRNDDKKYDIPSAAKAHSGYKSSYFVGARAGVSSFAGTEITGGGDISYQDRNGIAYTGIATGYAQAGLMGDAGVKAGVENGEAIAEASGDLFAGVRAGGDLTAQISKKDMSASVTGYGRVGIGVGIRGKVKMKISWSGVSWDINGGTYLGIGGEVGLTGNINWGKALDPVKKKIVTEIKSIKTKGRKFIQTSKKKYVAFKNNLKNKITSFSGNISKTLKRWF